MRCVIFTCQGLRLLLCTQSKPTLDIRLLAKVGIDGEEAAINGLASSSVQVSLAGLEFVKATQAMASLTPGRGPHAPLK